MPKVLEILQLFTVSDPRWRVDRIAERLSVSPSTAYRCVGALVRSGFLQPVSGGGYVLGPAFIEYDQRMRLSDPLLQAAMPHMRRLHAETGPQTTIVLARHYGDCVMFAHIERGRDAPPIHDRGQKISLFSPAATARAVLFALPDRVLRGLYRRHGIEIADSGLGSDAREFRARIKALRERGWVLARSVFAAGRIGIAAPIACESAVCGSLAVSVPEETEPSEIERIAGMTVREANLVAAQHIRATSGVSRLLGRQPSPPQPAAVGVSPPRQ